VAEIVVEILLSRTKVAFRGGLWHVIILTAALMDGVRLATANNSTSQIREIGIWPAEGLALEIENS
jgi:hypothetical protein